MSFESLNAQMHHLRLIFEKASMNPISCSFDFLFLCWSCGSRSVHHLATRCTSGLDSHPFKRESDLWAHTSEKCPRFASRWQIQDVVEQFSSEKTTRYLPLYWLGGRDDCNGLLVSPYHWVVKTHIWSKQPCFFQIIAHFKWTASYSKPVIRLGKKTLAQG